MAVRSRQARVLAVLFVSILIGAGILSALSHNPISASAFCLSRYYNLTPVGESVGHRVAQFPRRWNQIEIRYGNHLDSCTRARRGPGGVPEQSPSQSFTECDGTDCHFIICDGYVGYDGQIRSTESWRDQLAQDHSSRENAGQTIHICIATTGESAVPTDFQIRRTEALVEELCRRFRIQSEAIRYPSS